MEIKVTKDNVSISEKDLVHKGEYNVTDLNFIFSEEYEGLSKMAVFSNALETYEVAITNGSCIIPHEVLAKKGILTIGVYGYTTENNVVVKRYSPCPITIEINNGSYKKGLNAQAENPTLFEEFVEQLEGDIDNLQDQIDTKQDEITSDNKLLSDLVDDTNQTHKFVTTEEKTTWNNKSDFSGSYDDLTNKPFIPTKTSDIINNSGFITKDVNNLTNYELKVDTGHSIAVSIDTSTYVVTIALKNSAGDTISSGMVDLPLESVVVNGRYDNTSKSLILVLDNGNEVTIPVGDLVSGLVPDTRTIAGINLENDISKVDLQNAIDFSTKQNVIDSSNKLPSDYVDDTNQTNKFVTSEEKTTWNNKSDFSGSYTDLSNKPDLTVYEEKSNKVDTLNKRSTTEYLNQKGTYNNYSPLLTGQATGDFINLTNAYDTPLTQFELLGNATQDTTILTYKCVGTESGDYYFVYSSTNYQFTMPTISAGDILTFDTTTKKLYKGTTQITTTTASTGTLITLSVTPNPDYPQDIHVVTGDNTVKVLGKNLFEIRTPDYRGQQARQYYGGTAYSITGDTINIPTNYTAIAWQYDSLVVGGTYTFTATLTNTTTNSSAVRIGKNAYSGAPSGTGSSTSISLSANETKQATWTFTASETNRIYFSTETTQISVDFTNIQLEYNSTATPYEPYTSQTQLISLGSLELAKIGNYTDRIYKDNGKWYVEKNIGKTTLNGSENWNYSSTNTRFYTTGVTPKISPTIAVLSNYFEQGDTKTQDNKIETYGIGNNSQILISYSAYTIADDFKLWLTTHNTIVYYALATPTYTEITDTTLITALEEIYEINLNKPISNIWTEPSGTNAQASEWLSYQKDLATVISDLQNQIDLLST